MQLIHALLIGKIRFNLPTWGNVNVDIKTKINNIIHHTVNGVTNNIWYGRNIEWKMKQLKIPSFYRLHFDTCYKQTYKYINVDTMNMMNHILTKNRNINLFAQNKGNYFDQDEKPNYLSQQSFKNLMRKKYNAIPREITLSLNIFFKK